MCSIINRSHPFAIILGIGWARFDFIACLAAALVMGSSVTHAEIDRSANLENRSEAFGQTAEIPIWVDQHAFHKVGVMNENEAIAKLNPKLGKVLARLIRMQEQFPISERGESNHGSKPPIGMKPIDSHKTEDVGRSPSLGRTVETLSVGKSGYFERETV